MNPAQSATSTDRDTFGEAHTRPAPELRVVVYDPRPERLRRVRRALPGYQVGYVEEAAALACAAAGGCAVLVALGDPAGDDGALGAIRALAGGRSAAVCYGDGVDGWGLEAQCRPLAAGAAHLLDSADPHFEHELAERVEHLCHAERRRRADDARMRALMHGMGMVGESAAMLDAFRWAMRAGPQSRLPALILGETGTGKELLAHAIHQLDPLRSPGPFVAVNCAAISPGVAESELFGHRRGAYTGAQGDRRGLVRAADGGVLFLDEVGELDESLQGKLLRVLQQGRVLAVGEDTEVPVDVRVVAATNRDLEEMVRLGTFRGDLFHRLNVLALRVPALRERPEDVGPLVHHFVGAHSPAPAPRVTDAFVAALRRADLPGNVRQLENLIRRVLAGRDDPHPLALADLPPDILRQLAGGPCPGAPPPAAGMEPRQLLAAHGWSLARSLEHCEGALVRAALAEAQGNQTRAARMLGITARSVYNKVRKYGLGA